MSRGSRGARSASPRTTSCASGPANAISAAHARSRSRPSGTRPRKRGTSRRARGNEPDDDRRVPKLVDQDQQRHPSRRDEPAAKAEEEQSERQ